MSDTLDHEETPADPTAYHPIVDGDDEDVINRRTVSDLTFEQLQDYITIVRARRERFVARVRAASSGDGIAKTTAKMRALNTKAAGQVKKLDEMMEKLEDTITKMRALYIQLGDTPPNEPP